MTFEKPWCIRVIFVDGLLFDLIVNLHLVLRDGTCHIRL